MSSQIKHKSPFGDKISAREFKYIKFQTNQTTLALIVSLLEPTSALSNLRKDPNGQALFLELIVCDIHNSTQVNGYLQLGREQVVSLLLQRSLSLLKTLKKKNYKPPHYAIVLRKVQMPN